ncbi:MAG: chorismate-binding protein [Deltaproteobacteria bacterium]|nr:chorismate-binding protein [Deltaproteobacteria bacterium]
MQIRQFPEREKFCQQARHGNVVPVCAEILADTETPVSLLKKFYRQGKPIFLLESVEGGEKWGRYSFLGVSARCHLKVYRDTVTIQENGSTRTVEHGNDPLAVLKAYMAQFEPVTMPDLPRFWGGLVGYLTYEMVSFFEAIPNHEDADKPLAHFILPDELIIFDNIRHTLFCLVIGFPADDQDPGQVYAAAARRIEALLEEIGKPLPGNGGPEKRSDHKLAVHPEEGAYQPKVEAVKDHIRKGDIIQAVISQPFTCDNPPDPWSLYRAQRYVNPSPYLYFMHYDDMTLVGSSPETMVRLENGVATLRPIAGTRPRGETDRQDRLLADELLKDEKERAEHLMLVDLGRNDLGRVAETGSVQVTDLMIIERYSHVMHMVSNINCDLKRKHDAWDLLKATFPAGTLTGAPKVRAMEIIADMESCARGPYGGAVGYISFSGNLDMAITIRTACIQNGVLTVRAGAGIVADSDPERENQETINKAMAIQKALALVP